MAKHKKKYKRTNRKPHRPKRKSYLRDLSYCIFLYRVCANDDFDK